MRKWNKYFLHYESSKIIKENIAVTYEEHSSIAGGFGNDISYATKNDFFNKFYFSNYKFMYYHTYLLKHLNKEHNILSLACGRCVCELKLIENNFKITCSDLGELSSLNMTLNIFPEFKFIQLNILDLNLQFNKKYDTILCLCVAYSFDKKQFDLFLKNASSLLELNGILILEPTGSPNNLFNRIVHDVILKYEHYFLRWRYFYRNRVWPGLTIEHHGYFRTDKEIIEAANQYGFVIEIIENFDYFSEFKRSRILRKVEKLIPKGFKKIIKKHIMLIPHFRMFKFRKVNTSF